MGFEEVHDVSANGTSEDAIVINGFIKQIMSEGMPLLPDQDDTSGEKDSPDVLKEDASTLAAMLGSDADAHAMEETRGEEAKGGPQQRQELKADKDHVMREDAKEIPKEDGNAQEGPDVVESPGSEDTEDASSESIEATVADAADPLKGGTGQVRKPLPPFLMFSKEQRAQVKKDHPDASFKEMNVLLGDKWKNVSEEERKSYEARYHVDKDVYLKGLQGAVQEARVTKKTETRSRRKGKDPDKPKHQITAFFAFGNVRRPALLAEKISVPEIGRILGDEWKNMDEEARCQYEKIAAQDKIRYATELEAYKKRKAEEAAILEKQMQEKKEYAMQTSKLLKQKDRNIMTKQLLKEERSSQRKRQKVDDEPDKPKKPPTAYLLFGHEVRQAALKENPALTFVDINTIVSTKWRELVDEEKQKWLNKAASALERYKTDLSEYHAKRRGLPEGSTAS